MSTAKKQTPNLSNIELLENYRETYSSFIQSFMRMHDVDGMRDALVAALFEAGMNQNKSIVGPERIDSLYECYTLLEEIESIVIYRDHLANAGITT